MKRERVKKRKKKLSAFAKVIETLGFRQTLNFRLFGKVYRLIINILALGLSFDCDEIILRKKHEEIFCENVVLFFGKEGKLLGRQCSMYVVCTLYLQLFAN